MAQCHYWLQKHYPNAKLIEADSTTDAVAICKRQSNSAAIASDLAANLYGLKIITSNIQDYPDNRTRFLIIGNQLSQATGQDKTSFLFSLKNKAGALLEALEIFKVNQLNLKKIESRPSKRDVWTYYFYIDVDGHIDDPNVCQCLEHLKEKSLYFKVLGSYPREILK